VFQQHCDIPTVSGMAQKHKEHQKQTDNINLKITTVSQL
jgi:hypothetical protein